MGFAVTSLIGTVGCSAIEHVGAEVRSHALWRRGDGIGNCEWTGQGSVGWLRRSGRDGCEMRDGGLDTRDAGKYVRP